MSLFGLLKNMDRNAGVLFRLAAAAAMRYAVVKENSNPDTLMKMYENFHSADKLKEVYGLLKESISLKDVIKFCAEF